MSASLRQIAEIDNDKTYGYTVARVEEKPDGTFRIAMTQSMTSAPDVTIELIVAAENMAEWVTHINDLLDLQSERLLDFVEGKS